MLVRLCPLSTRWWVWPGPHKCGWCGATGPPVEGVGSGARGTTRGCLFFGVCVLPIPLRGLKGSEVYGVHAFDPLSALKGKRSMVSILWPIKGH